MDQKEIASNIESLLDEVNSVALATLNANGEVENSYTPFLLHKDKVYIFISALATHTANLEQNPQASLLFIQDEQNAKNIYARKRVILKCLACKTENNKESNVTILDLMEQRHGKTVSLLRTLPDFSLFELTVNEGSYVQGFGQAFSFDGFNFQHAQQVTGK